MKLLCIPHVVFSLVSVGVLGLGGCSLGQTFGCDFRDDSVNGAEPRCQERTFPIGGEVFAETCKALEGTAISGPCPEEGRVAGCEIDDGSLNGSRVVDWYYEPLTKEEIENTCKDDGDPLVTE